MRRHRIAAIPADGIGKEVVPAGLEVLRALAERSGDFALDVTDFPWGSDFYRRTGRMMPEDGLDTLRGFDAIFFGAVGDPELPDDLTLWGCGCASARASTSTPTSGRPACCRASPARRARSGPATSIG